MGQVMLAPSHEIKKTSSFINVNGDEIDPRTKRIIKQPEPQYVPPVQPEPKEVPSEVPGSLNNVIAKKIEEKIGSAIGDALGKMDLEGLISKAIDNVLKK